MPTSVFRRASLLLALAAAPAFAADAPTATPVRATISNPLPADLEFMDRPYQESGITLTFMVEGENLVGVKPEGVKVTAATDADGNDIAASRDGSPTWKMGHFPKAAKDGSRAFFDLVIDSGKKKKLLGAADGVSVNGTVTLLTSPGARKITKDNLKAGAAFKEAGLDFTVAEGPNGVTLTVKGPLSAISGDIVLSAGGKKLNGQGWFGSGDSRTYSFAKGAGPLTLEFSAWRDIREVQVPFHYGPKKK